MSDNNPSNEGVLHADVVEQMSGINDTLETLSSIDEELSSDEGYKKAYEILFEGYKRRRGVSVVGMRYLKDIERFITDKKTSDDNIVQAKVRAAQDFLRDSKVGQGD